MLPCTETRCLTVAKPGVPVKNQWLGWGMDASSRLTTTLYSECLDLHKKGEGG